MKLTSSNYLLILTALVVAGGAYWYFFTDSGSDTPITTATQESPHEAEFRRLVGKLGPITFDTSIFSDPRFNVLVNLGTPIAPESAGRADPFAPLAGASAVAVPRAR